MSFAPLCLTELGMPFFDAISTGQKIRQGIKQGTGNDGRLCLPGDFADVV